MRDKRMFVKDKPGSVFIEEYKGFNIYWYADSETRKEGISLFAYFADGRFYHSANTLKGIHRSIDNYYPCDWSGDTSKRFSKENIQNIKENMYLPSEVDVYFWAWAYLSDDLHCSEEKLKTCGKGDAPYIRGDIIHTKIRMVELFKKMKTMDEFSDDVFFPKPEWYDEFNV